jgi:hypothetical protein
VESFHSEKKDHFAGKIASVFIVGKGCIRFNNLSTARYGSAPISIIPDPFPTMKEELSHSFFHKKTGGLQRFAGTAQLAANQLPS